MLNSAAITASISSASVNASATVSKPGPRFAEVAGSRRCRLSPDAETGDSSREIATLLAAVALIASPQLREHVARRLPTHPAPASPNATEPKPAHVRAILRRIAT